MADRLFKKRLPVILFWLIFIAGIFVRFYNFSERVNYGPEQALSLNTSAGYLNEKFSLLGQMYFREGSSGHNLFSGAYFNYLLSILQVTVGYDPVRITAFFTLTNMVTGILVYFFAKKYFGKAIALFSFSFFVFDARMVYHSLFIWNYNLLPIVFLMTIYLCMEKSKKALHYFCIGVLSGLGISIQFLYFLPVFLIFIWLVSRKPGYKMLLTVLAGLALGNLPMLLFDIRHGFYHLRTLYEYFTTVLGQGTEFSLRYYHFIYLWTFKAVILGFFVGLTAKKYTVFSSFLIPLYVVFNLFSPLVNFASPVGMPEGLTAAKLLDCSRLISESASGNFNVAETYDFDSRANVLRYPIKYMYKNTNNLLGVTEYENAGELFVLSPLNYDYNNPIPWELIVYKPYKAELFRKIDDFWGLFRLTKK